MNKKLVTQIFALFTFLLFNINVYSQNIAINASGTAANLSSMLDISSGTSSNKGLLIPRVTSAQKTAMNPLPAAAQGLIVYQTDGVEGFYYNTSTTTTPVWSYLTPGGWSLLGNAGTVSATNFIGTTDAVDWVVRTTNTERMRVLAGGNVGIGIAVATQRLDVQGGNARINNAFIGDVGHGAGWGGISHSLMNSTTGYALIESNDGAYTLINKQNTGTGYIGFRVANSDVAVILNNGNVGLGLTNPAYNLEINGSFGYGNGSAGSYRSRTETRNDAGQIATQSGFYETASPTNYPAGAASWWHLIDTRHSNNGNNYALQIAGSFFDQNLYFRKTNNNGAQAWSQLLTTASASTGYIQNQFAGAQTPADHWVSGSSRASEVYAVNWFRVDGGGGLYWSAYGGGWYMQDATWIRGYNGRSLWMGSGLIGGDAGLTIGYGGTGSPGGGGIIAGTVGIGTTAPTSKLHVIADGDNIPVIFGINTNNTGGTTSYGVRGECAAIGLGSAGIIGVSTNAGQNEIGVAGDYSLWGASVFGLAWASSYTDMPTSRDMGVFGTCNFSTGTGVYARDMNGAAGSYAFYGTGKFAVTGAKAASVPTTKGNQLLYCTESPEMWFEDLGGGQLSNGQTHISLDELYFETVMINSEHPMHVFLQEQGESNGLIVILDADNKGFIVKEKNNGSSNIRFSYRIMAKRRFYEDHRFGVDSNQPFGDNLKNAKTVEPITQDPNVMREFVARETAKKEAEYKQAKALEAQKKKTTASSINGAGENKLVGNTPRPEDPVLINKSETKPGVNSNQIENNTTVIPK